MHFIQYRIYMDYNATTPLEPEVIQSVCEALQEAWGNPSSNYEAGEEYFCFQEQLLLNRKCKESHESKLHFVSLVLFNSPSLHTTINEIKVRRQVCEMYLYLQA